MKIYLSQFQQNFKAQNLQFMSSKLQNTLSELHKIKNQIRLELNQIRPFKDYSKKYQNATKKTQKKLFAEKDNQTNITPYLIPKNHETKIERKRHIQPHSLSCFQPSHSQQKKHFPKHYYDSVSTEMNTKRTKSHYLNIRTQKTEEKQEKYGNSLVGIGQTSIIMAQRSKQSIRVFPPQYLSSIGKSNRRKKSLFD